MTFFLPPRGLTIYNPRREPGDRRKTVRLAPQGVSLSAVTPLAGLFYHSSPSPPAGTGGYGWSSPIRGCRKTGISVIITGNPVAQANTVLWCPLTRCPCRPKQAAARQCSRMAERVKISHANPRACGVPICCKSRMVCRTITRF